jgi:hypothetical protein
MEYKGCCGEKVHSFRDMVEVGINHFNNLFKEPPCANIAKIVHMAASFLVLCSRNKTKIL